MKSSRAEIHRKYHKIPRLRFTAEGTLTPYAGLVLIQALVKKVELRARLRGCFSNTGKRLVYGPSTIMLLLIVAIMLGCRKLRDLDYCHEDVLLARVVGVTRLPDVATISRTLAVFDEQAIVQLRSEVRNMVHERLAYDRFPRTTIDFDGSVQSTQGHAQGTAVGYNPGRKGARSYLPLYCTVAQTGQFFDVLHRPGNVHDSNGASDFILSCLWEMSLRHPHSQLETRLDSAFFNEIVFLSLEEHSVEFTCSVPFERFPRLKEMIEQCEQWKVHDETWSFFESEWKPEKWDDKYRLLFARQRRKKRLSGALQLDLFVPRDYEYEYTVIATNKRLSAKRVLLFHHGRGSQEKLLGEGKQHAALGVVMGKRLHANQAFTLAGMMAHNLSREMQMTERASERTTGAKRPAHWTFHNLGTLRQRLFHRAGRLLRPGGELTLELNANSAVQAEFMSYLNSLTGFQ